MAWSIEGGQCSFDLMELIVTAVSATNCHRAKKANANTDALSRIDYSTSATN